MQAQRRAFSGIPQENVTILRCYKSSQIKIKKLVTKRTNLFADDSRADKKTEQAASFGDELGRDPPLHCHPLPHLLLPKVRITFELKSYPI
jgi:hypothetical protein